MLVNHPFRPIDPVPFQGLWRNHPNYHIHSFTWWKKDHQALWLIWLDRIIFQPYLCNLATGICSWLWMLQVVTWIDCYLCWCNVISRKWVFNLIWWLWYIYCLTNLPLVLHICVGLRVSISSGNGLSPVRCQAITWTNADLLSIGPLGTNFSEIQIEIENISFMKMHVKMSSSKWRTFCYGEDELNGFVSLFLLVLWSLWYAKKILAKFVCVISKPKYCFTFLHIYVLRQIAAQNFISLWLSL